MPRRLALLALILSLSVTAPTAWAEPLTLPPEQRPPWLRQDGIVMAGSWEPLGFRVRRDGAKDYTPTPAQRAAYEREHSPEMIARLKALGVNFVMMHCHKGAGLEAERESMADAVRFAKLCHDHGLRVGVYIGSGTVLWDLLIKEIPQVKDWAVCGPDGNPRTYGRATYRYYWNRNHPEAAAYHRQILRYAVEEIRTDLIHCDNYFVGPGTDANSTERFRVYVHDTFSPAQRAAMGAAQLNTLKPPTKDSPALLQYAWREFSCRSLSDSYLEVARYARSLRPDILMECNPGGVRPGIEPAVDHGRLLQGGEAFWDEGISPGYRKGRLYSRIPTYKVARLMNNMAFAYVRTPLEMAESMAFNRDCLGCVCWFEYAEIHRMPGSDAPMAPELAPFIRFFHARRDLMRDAEVVADVAVLRSFPSQVFGGPENVQLSHGVEQDLISSRQCFQIVYDHHLQDLRRYRVLVLAGCTAMGDAQVEQVRRYVEAGGRLCVVGPLATHDEWNQPRPKAALDDLPAGRAVRIAKDGDRLAAIRRTCENVTPVEVAGPTGLCAELTEQPGRRLLHLVNYREDQPAKDIRVRLRLPAGKRAKTVTLASPEHAKDVSVRFEESGGVVVFSVPAVRVYEIAVVAMQ